MFFTTVTIHPHNVTQFDKDLFNEQFHNGSLSDDLMAIGKRDELEGIIALKAVNQQRELVSPHESTMRVTWITNYHAHGNYRVEISVAG